MESTECDMALYRERIEVVPLCPCRGLVTLFGTAPGLTTKTTLVEMQGRVLRGFRNKRSPISSRTTLIPLPSCITRPSDVYLGDRTRTMHGRTGSCPGAVSGRSSPGPSFSLFLLVTSPHPPLHPILGVLMSPPFPRVS